MVAMLGRPQRGSATAFACREGSHAIERRVVQGCAAHAIEYGLTVAVVGSPLEWFERLPSTQSRVDRVRRAAMEAVDAAAVAAAAAPSSGSLPSVATTIAESRAPEAESDASGEEGDRFDESSLSSLRIATGYRKYASAGSFSGPIARAAALSAAVAATAPGSSVAENVRFDVLLPPPTGSVVFVEAPASSFGAITDKIREIAASAEYVPLSAHADELTCLADVVSPCWYRSSCRLGGRVTLKSAAPRPPAGCIRCGVSRGVAPSQCGL